MARTRPKPITYESALAELKKHRRYSREAEAHIRRIFLSGRVVDSEPETIRSRRDAVKRLMDKRWASRSTLPAILAAVHPNSPGALEVVGGHRNLNMRSRPIAFRVMSNTAHGLEPLDNYKRVMGILEHEKTTRRNAYVFLTALERYGYDRTSNLMDREGINADNILQVLQRLEMDKEMKRTQRIVLS